MAWAYIATAAGVPMAETFALATEQHLIVRAFYTRAAAPAALPQARNLVPGHTIVLLYVNQGNIEGALRCVLVDATDVGLVWLRKYPEPAAPHPVIANDQDNIPHCFGVAEDDSQQAEAIVEAGYDQDRMDSQIGEWVALAVEVKEPIDQVPIEWQEWYDALAFAIPALRIFPDHLAQIEIAEPVQQP